MRNQLHRRPEVKKGGDRCVNFVPLISVRMQVIPSWAVQYLQSGWFLQDSVIGQIGLNLFSLLKKRAVTSLRYLLGRQCLCPHHFVTCAGLDLLLQLFITLCDTRSIAITLHLTEVLANGTSNQEISPGR